MASSPAAAGTGGSQTLERGLVILTLLAERPEGLSTSEVATDTGLHRSIVHRLLVSLQRTGFAERDDRGAYVLGPAAVGLARRGRPSLHALAEPVLQGLADRIGATASLVEVIGDAAVTTVVAEPPTHGPRFSYRLGNRDPLDRGAGGLAALAARPEVEGEPVRVAEVRTDGVVVTRAEINPGAIGVAAPVRGAATGAAVNVVTADEEIVPRAVELVQEAAQTLSVGLR